MTAPTSNPADQPNAIESGLSRLEILDRFRKSDGGILIVGHGTRNQSGVGQLLELVSQMQKRAPNAIIAPSLLELAQPSILESIRSLHLNSIRQILVVPVLLFTAGHAREDIPDAVEQAIKPYGIQLVGQTEALGTHPSVLSLSASRYNEVVALSNGVCCPSKACAMVRCPLGICRGQGQTMGRIGLAMVGRGTSDQQALAHMRQLTRLRVAQTSNPIFETGFFAGGVPDVDGLLQQASQWDCKTIVVQPHLLFDGELVDELRRKVIEWQLKQPDRLWLITRTLGADPMLADVFLDLAEEALKNA